MVKRHEFVYGLFNFDEDLTPTLSKGEGEEASPLPLSKREGEEASPLPLSKGEGKKPVTNEK